jgi:hypothetical protein
MLYIYNIIHLCIIEEKRLYIQTHSMLEIEERTKEKLVDETENERNI